MIFLIVEKKLKNVEGSMAKHGSIRNKIQKSKMKMSSSGIEAGRHSNPARANTQDQDTWLNLTRYNNNHTHAHGETDQMPFLENFYEAHRVFIHSNPAHELFSPNSTIHTPLEISHNAQHEYDIHLT